MKAVYLIACGSIGFAGSFFAVPPSAYAEGPSFDCAKATTRAEKAICQDEQLAALDTALLATLKSALEANSASRDTLLSQERQWVRERDRTCIPASVAQLSLATTRSAFARPIGSASRL